MRATDLKFRSPKERTPAAYLPTTTNQGKSLTVSARRFRPNLPQARRFPQYELDARRTGYTVGPGQYETTNEDISKRRMKGVPLYKEAHGKKNMGNNGYYYIGNHVVFDPCFLKKNDKNLRVDQTQILTNRPNTVGPKRKFIEQDSYRSFYMNSKTEKKLKYRNKPDYKAMKSPIKQTRKEE